MHDHKQTVMEWGGINNVKRWGEFTVREAAWQILISGIPR